MLGGIDIGPHPCDDYLALTGPPRGGSAGVRHPRRITGVYLFDMAKLLVVLQKRGVKIGIATSLRRADVVAARIFPESNRSPLPLSSDQAACCGCSAGRRQRRDEACTAF